MKDRGRRSDVPRNTRIYLEGDAAPVEKRLGEKLGHDFHPFARNQERLSFSALRSTYKLDHSVRNQVGRYRRRLPAPDEVLEGNALRRSVGGGRNRPEVRFWHNIAARCQREEAQTE